MQHPSCVDIFIKLSQSLAFITIDYHYHGQQYSDNVNKYSREISQTSEGHNFTSVAMNVVGHVTVLSYVCVHTAVLTHLSRSLIV